MKTLKKRKNRFSWVLGVVLSLMFCQRSIAQELQTPYPIIFVHGLTSDNRTWDELISFMKNQYGLSYGGRMDFCLNQDANNLTSNLATDYKDYTNTDNLHKITKGDLYTINFNVDNFGTPYDINVLSNQAGIVKQGLAVRDAIKHVLEITGRDKVILVGHSMGGLASREYLQNKNLWNEPYVYHHVAKLCTIGTPHGGSNGSDFGTGITDIDIHSEAVRDLRESYSVVKTKGVYLFGGVENLDYMRENLLYSSFYNADVNCNGLTEEIIIGLNNKYPTNDLAYSCLIGLDDKLGADGNPFERGDGVVSEYRANINNYLNVNADVFPLTKSSGVLTVWHTELTKQTETIMKVLDEPSEPDLAYEIEENSTNKGTVTYQEDNIPYDIDLFKINLKVDGLLKISMLANSFSGVKQIDLLDSPGLNRIKYTTNINEVLETSLAAGLYYIRIQSIATATSYQNPYSLISNFVATPATILATSPTSSLEFYDVVTNTNRVKTVKITNNGASNIQITNLAFSGANANQYSVTPLPPFAVNAGASIDLTVKLSPTSVGVKLANLVITNNATTTNTIALKGTAVSTATKVLVSSSGASYNFGDTKVNSSRSKTFTIQNTGSNTFTISNLKLEGTNPEAYSITSPSATAFDIASGEVKQITVKFLTSTIGVKNAQLAIYNNADNASPKYSIDLFSNGKENIYSGSNSIITAYEYWFNDNYTNKVYVEVPPQQITTINKDFSTTDLKEGLHILHFRLKDSKGKWSSIVSEAFHKLTVSPSGQRKISLYEYWFDNDYAQKITSTVTPTQIDVLNKNFSTDLLTVGLHCYHIRYQDNVGQWSSVVSEFFHKLPVSAGGNKITAYRYWFDRDEKNITTVNVTNTDNPYFLIRDMNALNLSLGAHTIHFQFKDSRQLWSAVTNNSLTKTQSANGLNNLTYNDQINTYPNPVENILKVNIHKPFIEDFKLEIYNSLGIMKKSIIKSKMDTEFNLDLSTYPSGMYLIKFSNNEEIYQMKVIKK